MKLKDFAAKLESSLRSIFPNNYLKLEYSENIWESKPAIFPSFIAAFKFYKGHPDRDIL